MFDNPWGNYQPEDEDDEYDYERGESREEGFPEGVNEDTWKLYPKRWSTMVLLTELNSGNNYTEKEYVDAALAMIKKGTFECSWSEKFGEVCFWPGEIPLDQVKSEVL